MTVFIKRNLLNSIAVITIILFSGCAVVTGHKSSLNEFDSKVLKNDCNLTDIEKRLENNDDPLLWAIQGGSLARNCQNYVKSNHYFDYAENLYKDVDTDNIGQDALEGTGSVLLNNNVNDFEGNIYETIMVNTYKALNFASLGDFENARVEFNRALDRQRRAKEFFEKEIKEINKKVEKEEREFKQKQANKKSSQNSFNSPNRVLENKTTQKVVYEQYSQSFAQFQAYPDFINPFTTYIAGLYFTLNNDPLKGRDLLREALGMHPQNMQISKDFKLSNDLVNNNIGSKNKKYIWLIYENGNSIRIKENQIKVPLFLASQSLYPVPIAFPILDEQKNSHSFIALNGIKTAQVANMDRVIKTEFQKRYKIIITQILMSNILKAYLQYELNNEFGAVGGLLGAAFQSVTNSADVRSWTTLPKDFQVARIENLENLVEIKSDKGVLLGKVDVPKDKNVIIYLRSEVAQNNRIHKIIF